MTDAKALSLISYGLYIVTSVSSENKTNGMIVNSFFQTTADPCRAAVSVNKKSLSHEYISQTKKLAVMPLQKSAQMPFIGRFGFRKGRDFNKLEGVNIKTTVSGLPVVLENTAAVLELAVDKTEDEGSHTVFFGNIVSAEILTPPPDGECMTYHYYQTVLKGKTPEGATHR